MTNSKKSIKKDPLDGLSMSRKMTDENALDPIEKKKIFDDDDDDDDFDLPLDDLDTFDDFGDDDEDNY